MNFVFGFVAGLMVGIALTETAMYPKEKRIREEIRKELFPEWLFGD